MIWNQYLSSLGLALCCSWLILLLAFLLIGPASPRRSWMLQWGSVLVGLLVFGTAVVAVTNGWQTAQVGQTGSWILASWVALSFWSFGMVVYNRRALPEAAPIADWAVWLVALLGGWAGGLMAYFFMDYKQAGCAVWGGMGMMGALNFLFWTVLTG